jgi:phosphatidylinositol alpha-mannosyltransferase
MKSASIIPKLKIGFVFDDSLDSYDGVAQYVKTLGVWYVSQGHEVCYLVGETKAKQWYGGKIYSLSKNIKVTFNGNQAKIPLIANKKSIKKVLATENFDILHVQVPYSPFMAQKVINRANKNTAIVGTFHVLPSGLLSDYGSRALRLLYGRSLKRFDQILSVSPAAATFAKKAFGISSQVVPNAVDVSRFAHKKNRQSGDVKKIVFLGRLVPRKGCKELIKAFKILHQTKPTTKLIIAGKGPMLNELKKLTAQLGLNGSVEFLGFISEEEKPSLLASADIACFPSLGGESFGIVLIEAMAAGSEVVIGGDNPGYSSVLAGKPELLIDPKNAEATAKILGNLLSNKRKAAEISKWQQNEVKKYDVAKVGSTLLEIYNSAIAKRVSKRDN